MKEENQEQKWLLRLYESMIRSKRQDYISWWLRFDYPEEENTTAKINYWLNKSVAKGKLKKESSKHYTKYSIK